MSKYNKTYMECLEIAAARLGTPELAIDIQFAHEDKHYELMQTAAELYLYLSDLHKNSVMQAEGSASAEGAAVGQRSVGTVAEAFGCAQVHNFSIIRFGKCLHCGQSYLLSEAPSGGQP
jgi:hypothetical protein